MQVWAAAHKGPLPPVTVEGLSVVTAPEPYVSRVPNSSSSRASEISRGPQHARVHAPPASMGKLQAMEAEDGGGRERDGGGVEMGEAEELGGVGL